MDIQSTILRKIRDNLATNEIKLVNESDKHLGHAGHDGSGSSHFRLEVVSSVFEDLSRLERQKLIYSILNQDVMNKIHALSLKLMTPEESKKIKKI